MSSFLKQFQETWNRHIGVSSHELIHPTRDWHILLVVFVLCIMLFLFGSGYVFIDITQGVLDEQREELVASKNRFREASLTDILERYEARRVSFEEFRAGEGIPENPAQ